MILLRVIALLALIGLVIVPIQVTCATDLSGAQLPVGDYVDARFYDSVNAAVAVAHGKILVISDAQKLSGNLIIPADVTLSIVKGGTLVKSANYTMTFSGLFTAGLYQVFDGFKQGDILFNSGSVKAVLPQWWGENSAANINKAINAFPVVYCPPGLYRIESEVLLNSNSHLRGERGKTIFQRPKGTRYSGKNIAGVPYADPFMVGFYTYGSGNYSARTNVTVEGITIDGNSYNSTDSGRLTGVYMHSGSHIRVIDCEAKNLGRTADFVLSSGIVFSWIKDGIIKKCQGHDNSGDGINVFAFNQDVVVTENETYHNGVAGIEVEGRLGTSYTLPRNKGITVSNNYSHDNAGAPFGAGGMSYGHGILIGWSDDVTVNNNVVSNNSVWIGAITVLGSTNIRITNNIVNNNSVASNVDPTGFAIGIFAHYDAFRESGINRNIFIANNKLHNNHKGILIKDAFDITVEGNSIERTDFPSSGIICDKGHAGENVQIKNNVIKLDSRSTAIGIASDYNGINISGNQISDALNGIAFTREGIKITNLHVSENIFDGLSVGLFSSAGVSISKGTITKNVFRRIREMDLQGSKGGDTILSSVGIYDNIHDKGSRFWNLKESKPTLGY